MSREEKARDIASKSLASLIRRREIRENADRFFEENRDRIAQEVLSAEVDFELDEIDNQFLGVDTPESQLVDSSDRPYTSEKSLARRIEEFGLGIVSQIEFAISEWEAKIRRSDLATGFRRGQVSREDENLTAESQNVEINEVVNWEPDSISSTIIGCQILLVWKGRGTPPRRPNLKVVYDEEPAPFEEKSKDARTIEISIDQPKPSRFVIDVIDPGEYVINLYSS